MNEIGRIIARLRLAAASAEAQSDELLRHAMESRALAEELEADPKALASVQERAINLFTRPRSHIGVEFAVRRATSGALLAKGPKEGGARGKNDQG